VYLSSNGIHNLTETTWANMLCQARDMVRVARANGVITRVAENFFRMPIDRFAQTVRDSGYIGRIGRILSYADHTGYHNNSRWIVFAKSHPLWVQAIEHVMAHPGFYSLPQRLHTEEEYKARFFGFPGDFIVTDIGSGHVKGHLGRHPRPGYTEWHGDRGTLVHHAPGPHWGNEETQIRYCSEATLAPAQEAAGKPWGGGVADEIIPVVYERENDLWTGCHAETSQGCISYQNPGPTGAKVGSESNDTWYGAAVMGHVMDFALAIRGLRESEFTDEDALMSEMMEIGARESNLNEGKRIKLPIESDLETDAITRESLRQKFGVDPLDVEAMLAISYPRL
jgi:predicted dehydrogenase